MFLSPWLHAVKLSLWDWRLRRVVYSYAAAQDDWALQLERCHPVSALSPDGNVLAAGERSAVWVLGCVAG